MFAGCSMVSLAQSNLDFCVPPSSHYLYLRFQPLDHLKMGEEMLLPGSGGEAACTGRCGEDVVTVNIHITGGVNILDVDVPRVLPVSTQWVNWATSRLPL